MRLAFLRQRRRLFMEFDPAKASLSPEPSSIQSNSHLGVKRRLSQQATSPISQSATSSPFKLSRDDGTQHSSRYSPLASHMSSNQPPRSTQGSSFTIRPSHFAGQGSSSRSAGPSKRGGKGGLIKKTLLESPLHDEKYIEQEYNQPPLPIKKIHESTPKSSLGNFSMIAIGKLPHYSTVEGVVDEGAKRLHVWRYIVSLAFLSNTP
jgi:small subunit ribosomal protein S24e